MQQLLRNGRGYAFAPIKAGSVLAPTVKLDVVPKQERIADWLAKPKCAQLVIDLLDRMLRYHAWKRGLRFDQMHKLFYFTRSKPKSIYWEIGGRRIQQEVTAPLMIWNKTSFGIEAVAQFGWRHRAVRAGFVQIQNALFVRLEPTWFMTELDGRTPATAQPVAPVDSQFDRCGSSVQRLRSLQFWSTVFTKGHRELRITTGTNPIRVRLTPSGGASESVIANIGTNSDKLVLPDMDDVQLIPQLSPVEP